MKYFLAFFMTLFSFNAFEQKVGTNDTPLNTMVTQDASNVVITGGAIHARRVR